MNVEVSSIKDVFAKDIAEFNESLKSLKFCQTL